MADPASVPKFLNSTERRDGAVMNASGLAEGLKRQILERYCGVKVESVIGKNNRMMVLVDYSSRSFVIEFDGGNGFGVSEIRSAAENWLGGHERVVVSEDVGAALEMLEELISTQKNVGDESNPEA